MYELPARRRAIVVEFAVVLLMRSDSLTLVSLFSPSFLTVAFSQIEPPSWR